MFQSTPSFAALSALVLFRSFAVASPLKRGPCSALTRVAPAPRLLALLDLRLAAGVIQLLFRGFGVGLVDAFLDRLRRAVDQVLGFLQPQPGDFAHGLDYVDLVIT